MQKIKIQKNIAYPKVRLKDVLGAFWRGIKPQKLRLFILLGSLILANIVIIMVPIFYKQFFDVIAAGGDKNIIAGHLFLIIVYVACLNGVFWLLYRVASLSNNVYQPSTIAN